LHSYAVRLEIACSAQQCAGPDSQKRSAFARGTARALGSNCRKRMKAKLHPVLSMQRQRDESQLRCASRARIVCRQLQGASSAASVIALPGRHITECPPPVTQQASSFSPRAQLSRAALFGAQLRSSLHRKVACIRAGSSNACRRIAVQSHCWSRRPSVPVQSGPSPNKRLVPTANRRAPVGPRARGAAAAQP
jgi:hypothetical protein